MHYECERCGRIDRLGRLPDRDAYRPCAGCEDRTRWTPAFEDEGWP